MSKKCRMTMVVMLAALVVAAITFGVACSMKKNECTIKFDTGGIAAVDDIKAKKEETIVLPDGDAPYGYIFDGWYLSDSFSGGRYEAGTEYTVTENVTFYGKYDEGYEITLDLGGGSVDGETKISVMCVVGSNLATIVNAYVPEREHYEFDYWSYGGSQISSSVTMPSNDITVTAVYKAEVKAEIWAWDDDEHTSATHFSEYDIVRYASSGTSYNFGDPTTSLPSGLTLSSDQGSDGTYGTISSVSDDYTKNITKFYCDRGTFTVTLIANYPRATGLNNSANVGVYTVSFGETICLPDGTDEEVGDMLSCTGYLFLGWSENSYAVTAEYSADSVSGSLMVWDDSVGNYVLGDFAPEKIEYTPTGTAVLYAVWLTGYTDMFGSSDLVFKPDDAMGTVYLYRAGYYFESTRYNSSANVYEFGNEYNGGSVLYRLRLRSDGQFVYQDLYRYPENFYRYYYTQVSTGLVAELSESEYLHLWEYDDFDYYVKGDLYGSGTFSFNAAGECVLTFEGNLAGTIYTVELGMVGLLDGTYAYAYMLRNDAEYNMGLLTFGGVGLDETYGGFLGYLSTDYYYMALDGYNVCTYCYGGTIYGYYYYLDGDVLTLYSSSFSELEKYYYVAEADAWFYYYEVLDATFDLYEYDAATGEDVKIGEVTLDGLGTGIVTVGGVSREVYFMISYVVMGDEIVLVEPGVYSYVEYLYTYIDDHIALRLIPDTYSASYYLDMYGISYPIIALDADAVGRATLYIYAYNWYYGSWDFYPAVSGTYTVAKNDKYGFDYYVMTVDEVLWSSSYISYYVSAYDISEIVAMTEIAFVVTDLEMSDGTYYLVNVWLWYELAEPKGKGDASDGVGGDTGTDDGADGADDANETYLEAAISPYSVSTLSMQAGPVISALSETSGGGYDDFGWQIGFEPGEGATVLFGEYGMGEGGEMTFAINGNEYTSSDAEMLIVNSSIVYVVMPIDTDGDGVADDVLNLSGYVYASISTTDPSGDVFTAYMLYLSAIVDSTLVYGDEEPDGNYYLVYNYSYFSIDFETGIFAAVDRIPYYIYLGDMTNDPDMSVYLDIDLLGGDVVYYTDKDNNTHEGAVETVGTTVSDLPIYKFTSGDGEAFEFVLLALTTSDGTIDIFIVYDEANKIVFTETDGIAVFETDGIGFGARYTDERGNVYDLDYTEFYIVEEDEFDLYGTGYWEKGYIEIYVDGVFVVLDIDDDEGHTFTVRGGEYGSYYVVDNQIFAYIVGLDGYGVLYVYAYEDGEPIGSAEGSYTVSDAYVELLWKWDEGEIYITIDGVIDGYYIWVDRADFACSLVDSDDWTVIVLQGTGFAERYLSDGTIETGSYSVLDDEFLYYISDDGVPYVYRYDVAGASAIKVDYSVSGITYYNSDMSESIYFTTTGRVSFSGGTYYFYVLDGTTARIYYTPVSGEGKTEPNRYGYCVAEIDLMNTSVQLGGETYFQIGSSVTFVRLDEESGDYGYFTYGDVDDNGEPKVYELRQLVFTPAGDEFDLTGTLYYGLPGESSSTMTVDIIRAYNSEKDAYELYFMVGTYVWSEVDYIVYDISVSMDLDGTSTYSITAMELYEPMLSLDYLYAYDYSEYCYCVYVICYNYYYYYIYTEPNAELALECYYHALEWYNLWYYYYIYYPYYYSELYLIIPYGETCSETGEMYASGYIMPYLLHDLDGYTFTFDHESVRVSSYGYEFDFVSYDGATYTVSFFANSAYMEYYGFMTFMIYEFSTVDDLYTTPQGDFGDYYRVRVTETIWTDFSSVPDIDLRLSVFVYNEETNAYEETYLDGAGYIYFDDYTGEETEYRIYYVYKEYGEAGELESTQYYLLTFTVSDDGEVSVAVDKLESATYFVVEDDEAGSGTSYIGSYVDLLTYENAEGEEVAEIVVVYICATSYDEESESYVVESGMYQVMSCSYDDEADVYTIETYYGDVFEITLSDDDSYTAKMTYVGNSNEVEEGDDADPERLEG